MQQSIIEFDPIEVASSLQISCNLCPIVHITQGKLYSFFKPNTSSLYNLFWVSTKMFRFCINQLKHVEMKFALNPSVNFIFSISDLQSARVGVELVTRSGQYQWWCSLPRVSSLVPAQQSHLTSLQTSLTHQSTMSTWVQAGHILSL